MPKKTKRLPVPVPSKPLFDWFDADKKNRGKLREAGYTDGQITNWRERGIPRAQLDQVATLMGITSPQYLAAVGQAPSVQSPTADYRTLSPEALEIARAFDQMQPQAREFIREQVFIYTVIDKSFPWLRHGKPIGKSYSEFERWHEENMETKQDLEGQKRGTRPRAFQK